MKLTPEEQEVFDFLDFKTSPTNPAPGIGEQVAGFRLMQEIGCGGGGVVFKALQVDLNRHVALKLIPLQPEDLQPGSAERIRREARLLAELRHPNVVEIYDSGIMPGYRWVAMRLVPGPTLTQVLASAADPFPHRGTEEWIPFLVSLLEQVASALGEAHRKEVLHRDVKPSNVLLDHDGGAFLVDFGLARRQPELGTDRTLGFLGTPKYSSPEQLKGEVLTPAADVYALGCIGFEALTGRVPFPKAGTVAGDRAVLLQIPKWRKRFAVPRDLRAVLDKCLEKKAEDRYANGEEVAEELHRFLHFQEVRASPRGLVSKALQRMRLRPLRFAAAFLLVGLFTATTYLGTAAMRSSAAMHSLEVEQLFLETQALLHARDWEDLQSLLDRADLLDPAFASICEIAADFHFNRGDFDRALPLFEALRDHGRVSFANRAGLGFCHWIAEGSSASLPAVRGEPLAGRDHYIQMICAEHQDRLHAAELHATAAIGLLGPSNFLYTSRAHYRLILGRYTQTIEDLKLCLALEPRSAWHQERMVHCLLRLGRGNEALRQAQLSHSLRPEEVKHGMAIVRSFLELGRLDESLAQLDRLESQDPRWNGLAMPTLRAKILRRLGREPEAIRLAKGALHDYPLAVGPKLQIILSLCNLHQVEEAKNWVKKLERADKVEWHDVDFLEFARALAAVGDLEAALLQCTHSRVSIRWKNLQVKLLRDLGRNEEARAAYIAGLLEEPGNLGLRIAFARFLFEQEYWEEAVEHGLQVVGLDPNHPYGNLLVAEGFLKMNIPGLAIGYSRGALQNRPNWTEALELEAACRAALGESR